jgi:mannose-1-phosphate guanylyltransferase
VSDPIAGFHPIVPAGGAGTRLWPLSRRDAPKFLLDVLGSGRSLIEATYDRLAPLTGPNGMTVVTGRAHRDAVAAQLPSAVEVIAEPSPRDSMAAIGLAAAVLARRQPDVIVGSFAADHVITGTDRFEAAVRQAVAVAREGLVVTIGIAATRPSTAFGYIEMGDSLGLAGAPSARHVEAFTEKPDALAAAQYLATGRYRWNAGMFIASARVLLDALAGQHPDLAAGLEEIAAAWDGPDREAVLAAGWPGLTKIAIDHAVAEPLAAAGGVGVVPGDFGWDDVGDWRSLGDLIAPASDGVRHVGTPRATVAIDSPGALVATTTGRAVAVVGLPDAIVVDTPDALLVTSREHTQSVKDVVADLTARRATDLL